MSERRPHWDEDLIEAVADMAWGVNPKNEGGYGRTFFEMTYDLIAAVEDWHRDRWTGVCESPEEVAREVKQAQAAIARVREQLHKPWKYECECCTRIWIALEGDSDD